MPSCFSNTPRPPFTNCKKVAVIGGGIAGLTVAYRLQKIGIHVDLYEARNRIGGRIFTAKTYGRVAELGGQNITDGGKAENLNRLIDELKLNLTSCRVYLNYSYFNGSELIQINEILKKRNIDPEILKQQFDRLAMTSLSMKEVLEGVIKPQDPLYKILAVLIAAYEGGPVEKLCPLYTNTLFHMLLGGLSSVHQKNPDEDAYVDLITIDGGNSLLPQKIATILTPRLHLNMPLTKVVKNKNNLFQLTFLNGTQVETDILVLAVPCSTYENIEFEDDIIPEEKLKAIRKIEYGRNSKIMVPFPNPPATNVGVVGDEIVSFFDRAQQLLTVYYTGDTSVFSPQTIACSYHQARPMIERGFENCPSFISPIYAKDEEDLSYEGPIGYSWPNDPYAKGSYSYIAKGQEDILTATVEQRGEIFKTLFAPLHQNLYFVGEHASILFDVPGTMEAACESGERVARAILQSVSQH